MHATAFEACADGVFTTGLYNSTGHAQLVISERLVSHPFAIAGEVAERILGDVMGCAMIGFDFQQCFDIACFEQPHLRLCPLSGQVRSKPVN